MNKWYKQLEPLTWGMVIYIVITLIIVAVIGYTSYLANR